jgi:hypothetical protein
LDNLISALKAVDARDRRRLHRSQVFFLGAGVFYALLFGLTWFAPPDDFPWLFRVVLSSFSLVFLTVGLLHRKGAHALAKIDYGEPLLAFLSAAERRCRFLPPRDLFIVIPFFLLLAITCSAALMLGLQRYLPGLDPAVGLLTCCLLFPLGGVVGYWLGLRWWRRVRQPLLRQIRSMRIALGAGEAGQGDGE